MDQKLDNHMQKYLRICSHEACDRLGSCCAAAAVYALGKFYRIPIEDDILAFSMSIRIPGAQGDAYSAYVGVCHFLWVYIDRSGDAFQALSSKWEHCFSALMDENGSLDGQTFSSVLMTAVAFLHSECAELPLLSTEGKPRQYYEKIYSDREAMFRHSPYAMEEQLTKAVMKADRALALKTLHDIQNQGEKAVVAKDPVRSAKNSMIGSIAFLARAAIQAGVNADTAFTLSDALIQQVEDMNSKSTILAFEKRILLQFIDIVSQQLENRYSAPITRVMHHIENNLNKRIGLKDAAAYAGVHPAYLSARFKKETGMNFSAYVMMRRIHESSYFVRHTQYSLSEIALLYGFSSQSHFITAFRQVMEMTPMEFRRRYLAE